MAGSKQSLPDRRTIIKSVFSTRVAAEGYRAALVGELPQKAAGKK